MRRLITRFVLFLAVWTLCVPLVFPKSYHASRFDVSLALEPGGNVHVTETVDFRFTGGPFTYTFREIPVRESDGIDSVRAFMDGQELPTGGGEQPGLQLERKRNSVRLVWRFPPTSDSSHSFVLQYRARGAVRREKERDLLLWRAIPGDHDYRIESSRITVSYPIDARLAGPASANRGKRLTSSDRGTTFEAGPIKKDNGVTVRLPFVQGTVLQAPPLWQQEAERREAEIWDSLKTALLVVLPLFLIAALLVIRLRQARTVELRSASPTTVVSPPENLPPALVGALRGAWSDWRTALGTLIDLGERGFVEIEAQPKSWWQNREFILRRKGDTGPLTPVEQILLRLVFGSAHPHAGQVRLRKAQRNLQRHWRAFTAAVKQEAQTQGFLDPDRQATRRKWIGWGVALVLLAAGGTALSLFAVGRQDQLMSIVMTITVGAAAFLLGLLVIILGSTLPVLTDSALGRKRSWDAFQKHLKHLASRKVSLEPSWLADYLPYAIVLGLGNQWAKAFKDQGVAGRITWLAGKEQFDGSDTAALAAVLSSSGAGHSSAGGHGGGSGGGGGSSGAG